MKEFEEKIISELAIIDENSVNMEREKIKEILDKLKKIAENESSQKWIRLLESEWLYYNGEVEKSFESNLEAYEMDLEEVGTEEKLNYYILNSLAVCYYGMKDYEKAIENYEKVIKIAPQYYQAYIDIATVYRNTGKYNKSIEYIDKVLKEVANGDIYYQALESKGRLMMSLQKYEEANQLLKEIEMEKKADAEYLEALALSYVYIKQYDKAKDYFLKAHELCQDSRLKECLEIKLELTDFCNDIYEDNPIFENITARDMILGLSKDRIQIIKTVFRSMKDKISMGKRYCEQFERQSRERLKRYSYNYILCLKGWSSSTPELSLGVSDNNLKKGGGFYLRYNNIGVVIDPGLNFFENLHKYNLYIQDIDIVIVSHNHIDHNSDLKKILDMNYQIENNIVYVIDKETYSSYIKDLESVEKKCRDNVLKIFPDASINERTLSLKIKDKGELKLVVCPTDHNCEGSFGFKLFLGEKVLGYTSDTRYTNEISDFFKDSDIIITNISETNREDLMLIELKKTHLGIYGVSELLKEMKKNKVLCLLTEFYGGFGDIRIEMADIVREYVGNDKLDIVPVDIGMTYFLDHETFLCNNCDGMIDRKKKVIARMGKESKRLFCLCENCLYM